MHLKIPRTLVRQASAMNGDNDCKCIRNFITFDEHAEERGKVKVSKDDDYGAPQGVRVSVFLRGLDRGRKDPTKVGQNVSEEQIRVDLVAKAMNLSEKVKGKVF